MPGYQPTPTGIEGLKARLDGVQRQLDAIRGAAGLQSSVIGSGGLTVTDDTGDPQVHIGALEGGGFGLEQIVGTDWVPLAALAGGAQAITIPAAYDDTVSGFDDSGWILDGDELTFHTYTGKFVLINVASQGSVTTSADAASLLLGYKLSGAQDRNPTNGKAGYLFVQIPGGSLGAALVYVEVIEGAPGDVTVQQAFRLYNETSGTGFGHADGRAIIVLPF